METHGGCSCVPCCGKSHASEDEEEITANFCQLGYRGYTSTAFDGSYQAIVYSQYDPLGLICPLLITLKIYLRDVFALGPEIGWDDALPDDILLSRSVKPEKTDGLPELIGFRDGSLMAYGCAIYIRWKKAKQEVKDPD